MEFASWISPEFKLYIIQDYKRLKLDENSRLSLGWNLNRELSKINYKIHTDAIKEYLLKELTGEQLSYKYASEADMINVALFNKQSKQWREENPNLKGNMRDYASLNELLILANMESYNAVLIGKGINQKERMTELRNLARIQLLSLEKLNDNGIKSLEDKPKRGNEANVPSSTLNSHSNRNTHIRLKELCWTFVSMPFSRSSIKQVGC